MCRSRRPHLIGDFSLPGPTLRAAGVNRIGNMLVPNASYVAFEQFLTPILDDMVRTQVAATEPHFAWSPASMIKLLGERIAHEDSIYYWCAKNDIPVR